MTIIRPTVSSVISAAYITFIFKSFIKLQTKARVNKPFINYFGKFLE